MSTLSAQVTPLFPIYLSLFSNRNMAMVTNVFLSFVVLYLVYLIALSFSSNKVALGSVLILSIEPSFYASSLNLAPEILYTLFLVLAFYFTASKPFANDNINLILQVTVLSISVLIRPIALITIIAVAILFLIYYVKTSKKIYIGSLILLLVPSIIWSCRNLLIHGIFNISSISSQNIFLYEGVASLSESEGITFEKAAEIEGTRKDNLLNSLSSINETFNYNNKRGLELIAEHPIGLLIVHLKGLLKISFGIFKSKYSIILSEIYKVDSKLFTGIIFIVLGLLIGCIWILMFFGFHPAFKADAHNTKLLLLFILTAILPATSYIAYARFRVPASPFISIIAALGLSHLLKLIRLRNLRSKNEIEFFIN
jgi:4-amino-4-deoxy-L-arabinose transferase-like glycosyltransferase